MGRPTVNYTQREQEQDYKFCALLYPDSTSYDLECVFNSLDSYFSEWYYIYHDKDTYTSDDIDEAMSEEREISFQIGDFKKPHYHFVLKKENPVKLGLVANQLHLPSNYIQRCKKMDKALQYLTHVNNPSKYQYSRSEIVCKSGYTVSRYFSKIDAMDKAQMLLEHIMNSPTDTKLSLISWALESGTYSELVRAYPIWKDAIYEMKCYK